jgi:hypothetical protein
LVFDSKATEEGGIVGFVVEIWWGLDTFLRVDLGDQRLVEPTKSYEIINKFGFLSRHLFFMTRV